MRTAEDVRRTMGEMKGAIMKFGQILSLMTGVVPDDMARRAGSAPGRRAADGLQPRRRGIRGGVRPLAAEGVPEVRKEPFAAASIGQVHRAVLHDGTPAAVKVQYPGVREAIEHDLANVGMMITLGAQVLAGARGRADRARPQRGHPRRAGLSARGRLAAALPRRVRGTRVHLRASRLPRADDVARACAGVREGQAVLGRAAARPGASATASARSSSATRSGPSTGTGSSTATRIPGTTCCATTARWRSWTTAASPSFRRRDARRFPPRATRACSRRPRGVARGDRSRAASCARTRRSRRRSCTSTCTGTGSRMLHERLAVHAGTGGAR